MKKVLITGESGNIGGQLYNYLKYYKKYTIINDNKHAADMRKHSKSALPCVFEYDYKHEIDIGDISSLFCLFNSIKPDIIIHTASYVGTGKCEEDTLGAFRANAEYLANLLSIMNAISPDCLFVNFSTTATMDPEAYSYNPITVNTRREPGTWYGKTKLMGEQIVKQMAKRWINFLPVFLFAGYPHDTSSIWASVFIDSLQGKKFEIKLDPNIHKQYEYLSNVIPILSQIVENPKSEMQDIIIAGPEAEKFSYFLETAEVNYKNIFKKDLIYTLNPKADYLKNHVADNKSMFKFANISEKKYNKDRKDFNTAIIEVLKTCEV